MTTLTEILPSLPADNQAALAAARAHTVTERSKIPSALLAMAMVEAGMYSQVYDMARDVQSHYRDHALYLMDMLGTNAEIDFDPNSTVGQVNISLLQAIANALGAKVATLRNKIVSYTTSTRQPFARLTLHDLLIARGTCPVKPVNQTEGYAVIEVNSAVEDHNPRLMIDNPRTGERVRVNSFYNVSKPGKYEAKIPPEFFGATLYVDDAYGVV